jgi:hypothetical protein
MLQSGEWFLRASSKGFHIFSEYQCRGEVLLVHFLPPPRAAPPRPSGAEAPPREAARFPIGGGAPLFMPKGAGGPLETPLGAAYWYEG